MLKRIFALFLAMTMVFSMLPVSAFAADDEDVMETIEETEAPEEVTEPVTEPETVPEETEEAVPEETEASAETEEPEAVELEEVEEEPAMDASIVASGNCGTNVTWSLDADGILSISGKGAMSNYASFSAPWSKYRSVINTVHISDGVTSIGSDAFYDCSSLTTIAIPNSVTSIGSDAFYICRSLTSITIPNSVTSIGDAAFYDCRSLTSIAIPNSVTSIGEYAFQHCSSLTSITIPNSVTSIGSGAFCNCSSLTTIAIPNSVTSIGSEVFQYCRSLTSITIPNSVTSIGKYAFQDCSSLTSITIPNSVTSIGKYAFYNCSSLTSIMIPDSVTSIGDDAFYDCRSLTNVTIGSSVTSIGASAFYNCISLASITIPGSVKVIGNNAFKSCSKLKEIKFQGDRPLIGNETFSGVTAIAYYPTGNTTYANVGNYGGNITWRPYVVGVVSGKCGTNLTWTLDENGTLTISGTGEMNDHSGWDDLGIKNIIIEEGVTSICSKAFLIEYEYRRIDSVTLPSSLKTIGADAFWQFEIGGGRCIVENVYLPSMEWWLKVSLENWGANPGSNTKNVHFNGELVKKLVIPDGTTKINDYAFCNWTIPSITIPKSLKSIGKDAFIQWTGGDSTDDSIINVMYISSIESWMAIDFANEFSSPLCGGYGYGISTGTANVYLNGELITDLVIPKGTTKIRDRIFAGWWSVVSVTIPDSVTSIGYAAFTGCGNLTSITIPSSVTSIGVGAFSGCSSLASITIPDSVTSIGEYAFHFCSSLTSVTIGKSVASIGEHALSYCRSLKEIYFFGNLPNINGNAFIGVTATAYYPAGNNTYKNAGQYGGNITWVPVTSNLGSGTCGKNLTWVLDENGKMTISGTGAMDDYEDDATPWNDLLPQIKSVVIEPGVTHLGDRAFQYASNMSSLSMPETLTSCGQYVFHGCTSLTSVRVPESLSVLGVGMFHSCSNLKSVTLPDGLKGTAAWAFYNCTSLTTITIPQGVTEIGRQMFWMCSNLETVNLPNVTKLENYAFADCPKLKNFVIPDTVTSIGNTVFRNCTSLKSMVIPNSVSEMGNNVFEGCTNLASVTLSESLTELGLYVFANCSSLTSIVIPEKITGIGGKTFYDCTNLKTITFQGDAPRINRNCFSGSFTANYPCSGKNWSSSVFKDTGATPKMVKYHPEKYYIESERVEPTCTKPGSYGEIRCGSCGTRIKAATVIPALGHSYEAVVTPPTCTTKGFTTYTCSACGDSYTGNETGLAPHTYQDGWFSSQEGHWHYCTVCSAQSPVEPHVPDRSAPTASADQLCKVCGYIMQTRKPIIVIDAPNSLVVAGKTMQLSYHVVPEQDVNVVWKLGEGDEAYATVSETGKLTAKAVKEQHTITVYAEDAQEVCVTGKVSISVCPVPTEISILEGSAFTVNVNEGGSLTFTAKCGPAGSAGNVVWKTSDSAGTYSSFRDNHDNTCAIYDLKLPSGKAASITLTASVAGTNVRSSVVIKLVSAPVPGSIRVSGPETIRGGTAASYKAAADMDEAMTGSWVFALRSQDSAYASITAAGKLTTKAVPEAVDVVVSAYTKDYPNVVGSTVVHLVPSVQQVTVQSPEAVLHDGLMSVNLAESKTLRLEAAVQPVGALQTGSWKTSSAAVATVDGSGLVSFNKAGTVTITFTANDGSKKSASVKICAGVPMMDLQINGAETLVSGDKATLQTSYSGNPTIKKLVWSSSDTTVATVTASGAVTTKTVYEEKTVTITAKATDGSGQTAKHVITVLPKANVLPVWDAYGNVVTNQTLYLDTRTSGVSLTAPAGAKWSSSAPKVVSVDNGRLTLLKAGSAAITVKSADGKQTAKVTIKVSTLVRSLTIVTDCSVPLTSGKGKLTLKTAVNADASNKAVTWKSSNPDVAAVTSAGAVSAKAGVLKDTEVVITATAKDGSGMTAQVTVKVIPAATAVHVYSVNAAACADGMQLRAGETLNGRTITLPVNKSFSLGAKVFPNALGAHADQTVAWKSSSAKIAQVDENGVVTALKAGTVTITVKTADGKTNTVKIKFV